MPPTRALGGLRVLKTGVLWKYGAVMMILCSFGVAVTWELKMLYSSLYLSFLVGLSTGLTLWGITLDIQIARDGF